MREVKWIAIALKCVIVHLSQLTMSDRLSYFFRPVDIFFEIEDHESSYHHNYVYLF